MPIRPDDTIRCSFCGRTQDQVRKMIAGSGNHNVFICDECIELCSEILEEELGKQEEEDVEDEKGYLEYRIEYQIKPIYEEYIKDGIIKRDGLKKFDEILKKLELKRSAQKNE